MAKRKSLFKIPQIVTIASFGDIITKRPEKMPYEEYRELRTIQNKRLKSRLRGVFIWKSKAIMQMKKDGSVNALGESWGTATRDMIPVLRIK